MDRAILFSVARSSLFGGKLTQSQVSGIEAILNEGERRHISADPRLLAYVLATAFHETGASMQPVAENLSYSAAGLRATWPTRFSAAEAASYARQPQRIANRAYANRMGNGDEASGDGWRYRGRGQVQLTGRDNYYRAGHELGIDLLASPDLALELGVSSSVLVLGMIEGWFTGRRLVDYIVGAKCDYLGARAIINASDKAALIAGYAEKFEAALRAAMAGAPAAIQAPAASPVNGALTLFGKLLLALFAGAKASA